MLILDEPTAGIDPVLRARLWDTSHAEAEAGVGVLGSTHYMQEAEQCDRLVLMDLGRVVATGSVADIIGSTRVVQLETLAWASAFSALTAHDLAVSLAGTRVRVADAEPRVVQGILDAAGIRAGLDVVPATLEETMTVIARNRDTSSP